MPIGVSQFQILSPDQANPYQYGLSRAVEARYQAAKAAEQEAKNPYVGRQSLADVLHQELINKYLPQEKEAAIKHQNLVNQYLPEDYQTTFASRRASTEGTKVSTELNQLKLKYPGLGESGIMGQIAQMRLQADHPEWARQINEAMNQQTMNQAQAQHQANATMQQAQSAQIPGYGEMTPIPSSSLANSIQPVLQQQGQPQQPQVAQAPQNNFNPLSLLARNINATIGGEEAKANYYNQGGARGGVAQKNMTALSNAIQQQHPDWDLERVGQATDAYLSGENKLPDGEELPIPSGRVQQSLQNVQSSNAPKALQTQYVQLDTLVHDLNNFDIDALSSFTGPGGAAKLQAEKIKMAENSPNVDPMARRYFTSVNQAILNMDAMRKSFGTSVVPEYVYQTLGKLANPNDSIWLDQKQVKQNFNATRNILSRNRDIMKYKIQHGVTSEIPDRLKLPSNEKEARQQEKEMKAADKITEEDIKHTAEKYNMSVEDVKKKLRQQGRL